MRASRSPCESLLRQKFKAIWRADNKAGLTTEVESDWVTVDATPPVVTFVRDAVGARAKRILDDDDVAYVGVTDFALRMLFDAFDPDSDIVKATWCLGSFPGACDTGEKVEIDYRRGEAVRDVGGLVDGVTYYSNFQVFNGAGNYADAITDGIRVDLKAPYCGSVMDGALFDRTAIGPTLVFNGVFVGDAKLTVLGGVQAGWVNFVDHGAGIGGYSATVVHQSMYGLVNDTNAAWKYVGMAGSTLYTMRLDHSQWYHTVVSTWDRLGNERKCYSDGFVFDATPPNTSLARLESALVMDPNWPGMQTVNHLIQASIEGIFDPETGIREYFVGAGTGPDGLDSIVPFISAGTSDGDVLLGGLELPDGDMMVTVCALLPCIIILVA